MNSEDSVKNGQIANSTETRVHPCLVPHIVDKIMMHFAGNNRELLSHRRVCYQWASSATKVFRQSNVIKVGRFSTSLSKLDRLIKLKNEPSCSLIPITKFSFGHETFQSENATQLSNFFLAFHDTIESLEIWIDSTSTLDCSKICTVLPISKLQFPKLKSLTFEYRRYVDELLYGNGHLLLWLVENSTSVEKLRLYFPREITLQSIECPGSVNQMLQSIFQRGGCFLKNLKTLELDFHLDDKILDSLTYHGMTKLQSLTLSLQGSSLSENTLLSLLSTLRHSLTYLKFDFLSEKTNICIKFPKMEQLKTISLSGMGMHVSGGVTFANFSYDSSLPKLQSLILKSWWDRPDWTQLLYPRTTVLNLEELILPEAVVKLDSMRQIVEKFPRLKRFEFQLPVQELQVLELIFQGLVELENLKIRKSCLLWDWGMNLPNADHIFTGISPRNCKLIHSSSGRFKTTNLFMYLSLKELQTSPGISNLKKLKRLEISDLQYFAEITDLTGYLGFMSMDSLVYLDAGRSSMGETCMRSLAERFPKNMNQQLKMPKPKFEYCSDEDDALELPTRCAFL